MDEIITTNNENLDTDIIDGVVQKGRNYILSHYSLTLQEQKIILLALAQLKNNIEACKPDPLEFEIPMKTIMKYLGIKSNSIYTSIRDIASRLTSHKIEIEDTGEEKFKFLVPIPYCEYQKGILHIRFDKDMKHELISAAENYMTTYLLSTFQEVRSSYSIRAYEILKTYLTDETIPFDKGYKTIIFSIEEFKLLIGASVKKIIDEKKQPIKDNVRIEERYTKYPDFRKNVLNVIIDELNRLTDIQVDVKEIKEHRVVKQLQISVRDKLTQEEMVKDHYSSVTQNMPEMFELIDIIHSFLPDLKATECAKLLALAQYDIKRIQMAKTMIDKMGGTDDYYNDITEMLQSLDNLPSFTDLVNINKNNN